jgi:hypothetical protein
MYLPESVRYENFGIIGKPARYPQAVILQGTVNFAFIHLFTWQLLFIRPPCTAEDPGGLLTIPQCS